MPRVTVWATARVAGFHRWPDAPAHRAYLRDVHRHLFYITAKVAVGHDNRAVEFHDLQDHILAWWNVPAADVGARSCEMLARELGDYLSAEGFTPVEIDVSEDGENGATVQFGAEA